LEQDVVGQARAVHTITRSVTVALSGLGQQDVPLGVYLLVGPSGTGKTHLARSLAERLHGDSSRLAIADCAQLGGRQDWQAFSRHLAPYFRHPVQDRGYRLMAMAPLSILLVERVERARPELVASLVSTFQTGQVMLPDGKCGSFRGSLVLLTSNLCGREIYEAGRQEIGFSSGAADLEESEKARVYQLCSTAAEKLWGADLLAHLDDLIVFHRLREHHLPFILRRLLLELNRQLTASGELTCEIEPEASSFLLARGAQFMRHGAWAMVKVFRRFVLFPIADLTMSGQVRRGSNIVVSLGNNDRLRFAVSGPAAASASPGARPRARVPVKWDEVPA
jgi:ATP-dependent Clp protease ATP-binding subunit ClpC